MTSFTQENLTDIEAAIAEGALEVEYQDKRVKYRSLEDMMKIRDLMRRELGLVSAKGSNRTVGVFCSGL